MTKIISILLFFTLCNTTFGQNNSINQSDLIGCWKYYPEESKFFPDMTVYRPCDYEPFPSKRVIKGRFKMNFRTNGECSYLKIGTTDINLMKPGKWTFNSSTNELEIFDLEMNSIRRFKIVRLEKQLLGIKKN
ncbi:hypothetical protein ACU8DI_15140 [Psychroserpens sp. BH13MA-6]